MSGGEPFNSFPVDNDDTTSRGQECATSGGWPGEEKRAREIQPRFASFFARDSSRSGALMCFVSCSSVSAVQTPLGTTSTYIHTPQVQCVRMDGMGGGPQGGLTPFLPVSHAIDSRPLLLLFFCAATPSPPLWEGKKHPKMYMVTWVRSYVGSHSGVFWPPSEPPSTHTHTHPARIPKPVRVGMLCPCWSSSPSSWFYPTLSCHSTLVTSIPAFGLVKCPFTLRLGYGCLNRTRATCVYG